MVASGQRPLKIPRIIYKDNIKTDIIEIMLVNGVLFSDACTGM
jgi:hypothetical protein